VGRGRADPARHRPRGRPQHRTGQGAGRPGRRRVLPGRPVRPALDRDAGPAHRPVPGAGGRPPRRGPAGVGPGGAAVPGTRSRRTPSSPPGRATARAAITG
jgi:hypothetical protein